MSRDGRFDSDATEQTPEECLLQYARVGDVNHTEQLLKDNTQGQVKLDINGKGQKKSNQGWTALHLSSYFGHVDIAKLLIKHGADINIVNDTGDTPLHKAAYTGREELVLLLLSHNANVFIRNGEGQTARDVCKNDDIKKLLKAAEETDLRKKNDQLLNAAREGNIGAIRELLRGNHPPDINSTDSLGNTALHCAAYRNNKEVAVLLLQNGIDPAIKNKRGQLAIDLAVTSSMKQILAVQPVKHLKKTVSRFEGLLLRKSRFLGWREVWVVLEKGVISFFISRADATTGARRKGYKYLDGAEVMLDEHDVAVFIIKYSNNARQRYSVPFKTYQQVDRQKWVNAITEHIEFNTYYLNQGVVDSDADDDMDVIPLGTMQDKLQVAQAHQQLLEKHVESLKIMCSDLVKHVENGTGSHSIHFHESPWSNIPAQLDKLLEYSRNVSFSLSHCLTVFSQQEEVRLLQLKEQQERCRVLQDALHALAQEHHELEKSITNPFHSPPRSPLYCDTDCDEFFDAFEGDVSPPPELSHPYNDSDRHSTGTACESETGFFASVSSGAASLTEPIKDPPRSKWGRSVLPVPMFSRNEFSVWSILKQCIGKELSKITMPVVFNEPLSFLQRLSENMEYSYLLESASNSDDPIKRIEYVSAFAVAAVTSNWERLGKPFNPLLGETYELVREDMGFRIVCEQVSHHPPVSAFQADSSHFIFSGAIHPKLKFWGRSVEIKPEGTVTVQLLKHNEVYTWTGVTCCVHNIIVGKLWMEQCGTMEIRCHSNGLSAALNFKPVGWFGKDLNRVEGFVFDRQKTKLRFIFGKWCSYLKSADATDYEEYLILKDQKPPSETSSSLPDLTSETKVEKVSTKNSNVNYLSLERSEEMTSQNNPDAFEAQLLWQVDPRPSYSTDYYHFTLFAMALNELTEGMESHLPQTDARLRPDIRRLEHGDIDGAASEKNRLEEKQREARKIRRKEKKTWEPLWFVSKPHTYAKEDTWYYKGGYWERNFANCPDIF